MKAFGILKMLVEQGEGQKVMSFAGRMSRENKRIDGLGRPLRRTAQTAERAIEQSTGIVDDVHALLTFNEED